jgi:hypothetical protein
MKTIHQIPLEVESKLMLGHIKDNIAITLGFVVSEDDQPDYYFAEVKEFRLISYGLTEETVIRDINNEIDFYFINNYSGIKASILSKI